jgi:pimeloyl-ACP methyl ester carboxylesterase
MDAWSIVTHDRRMEVFSMSERATESISVVDGPRIGVHVLAEGAGRTVIFCHAAPGAGTFDPDPAATRARGIRLLAIDRPGYGRSDPVAADAWSSVDGAARDIVAVLDERGIERVSVAGWSAGGRVALALAANHPDRVERVAMIATPAPNDAVPWVPPEQQAGLDALRDKPPAEVHRALGAMLQVIVPADPASDEALGPLGGSPADADALARPGVRDRLTVMLQAAFAQGTSGIAADIAGYGIRPWGFEPSDVAAKTLLVYGAADPIAGSRHGSWWQRQLPDARLEMTPGAGHLVVVPRWTRILSHLAPGR